MCVYDKVLPFLVNVKLSKNGTRMPSDVLVCWSFKLKPKYWLLRPFTIDRNWKSAIEAI